MPILLSNNLDCWQRGVGAPVAQWHRPMMMVPVPMPMMPQPMTMTMGPVAMMGPGPGPQIRAVGHAPHNSFMQLWPHHGGGVKPLQAGMGERSAVPDGAAPAESLPLAHAVVHSTNLSQAQQQPQQPQHQPQQHHAAVANPWSANASCGTASGRLPPTPLPLGVRPDAVASPAPLPAYSAGRYDGDGAAEAAAEQQVRQVGVSSQPSMLGHGTPLQVGQGASEVSSLAACPARDRLLTLRSLLTEGLVRRAHTHMTGSTGPTHAGPFPGRAHRLVRRSTRI